VQEHIKKYPTKDCSAFGCSTGTTTIPGCSSNSDAINEEEDPAKDGGSSSHAKLSGTTLVLFNLLSIMCFKTTSSI